MFDGAYVEICGNLGEDIAIKETKTGRKYGLLLVTVQKKSDTWSETNQPHYKTHWYRVYIWNQSLLESQSSSYKKGERVLIIGELDMVEGHISDKASAPQPNRSRMVISIKKNTGVTILPKEVFCPKVNEGKGVFILSEENNQPIMPLKLQRKTSSRNKPKYYRKINFNREAKYSLPTT